MCPPSRPTPDRARRAAARPPNGIVIIALAANLPADGVEPVNTQVRLYDALGTSHVANLAFSPVTIPGPPVSGTSEWDMTITVPDEAVPVPRSVRLQFGATGVPPVDAGTPEPIDQDFITAQLGK